MLVQLSPAARLVPPNQVSGAHWLVDDIAARRRFKVPQEAAAALVSSAEQMSEADLVDGLTRLAPQRSRDWWDRLVVTLRARRLILSQQEVENDERLRWMAAVRKQWTRYGWSEAAEYHMTTFDYPCVDYSVASAFRIDQQRMESFRSQERDDDRHKVDYLDRPAVDLPPIDTVEELASARQTWRRNVSAAPVTRARLLDLISVTFGETGSLRQGEGGAPLLRRTSPSGGARHPSEGYLIALLVDGLEPGIHHITMRPFGLRRIQALDPDANGLRTAFAETFGRYPHEPDALLVVTTRFERNMYRYREPRTFRTVHMDAGHLASTLRIAATAAGLQSGVYTCDNATAVEEVLGLDGLEEGYMLTVALSEGRDNDR